MIGEVMKKFFASFMFATFAALSVFVPADSAFAVEPVVDTVIQDQTSFFGTTTFEIAQPDSVTCDNVSGVGQCQFTVQIRATSTDANGMAYANGQITDAQGTLLNGYWPSSTLILSGSGLGVWKDYQVSVTAPADMNVFLIIKPLVGHNYGVIRQSPIFLDVRTPAEQADLEAANNAKVMAVYNGIKTSLLCKKGKKSRRVTGAPPHCPAGYKSPAMKLLTTKAFIGCSLYKKSLGVSTATLSDGGKTLVFQGFSKGSGIFNVLVTDLGCALDVMGIPQSVRTQMSMTNALSGIQSAEVGKLHLKWTYHPTPGMWLSVSYY